MCDQPRLRGIGCVPERARDASGQAVALRWDLPEVQVSQAWVLYAAELHDEAVRMVKKAIERKRDCEGAYYLLCRALFAAGRYQEIVDVAEDAISRSHRQPTPLSSVRYDSNPIISVAISVAQHRLRRIGQCRA